MSETNDAIRELQQAITSQNEINIQLALAEKDKTLAEREKTLELQRQTSEIEKQRLSREAHTKVLEELVKSIISLINALNTLLEKKHFENIEQLMELLIPILSQASTTLTLRKSEIERLERLVVGARRQDVNVNSGTKINKFDNYGQTDINEN